MQKGTKLSKEARERIRQSALKRDNAPRIAALPRKEKHWNWNPNPSVNALHRRLHRAFGKASSHKCPCGKQARDWANKDGRYSDDLNDYEPLCRSCHVKKDRNWEKKHHERSN